MKNKSNPIAAYFVGAWEEINKVTWPTKEQALLLTGVVVGVSAVVVVLLGIFDIGVSQAYQWMLSKLSS